MATTQKIYIDPNYTGLWKVSQTAEAAKKASELLQQDLEVSQTFELVLALMELGSSDIRM